MAMMMITIIMNDWLMMDLAAIATAGTSKYFMKHVLEGDFRKERHPDRGAGATGGKCLFISCPLWKVLHFAAILIQVDKNRLAAW